MTDFIPVAEETLAVEKRRILTGRVRVSTHTETVDESVDMPLERSAVAVERHAVNRPIDTVPPVRVEGNVTIVPVVEEVLVVEKRLILKEEIRITRHESVEQVRVPVTLRKQRAEVEREDLSPLVNTDEDIK